MTRFLTVLLSLSFVFTAIGCGNDKESNSSTKPAVTQPRSSLIDINLASADELMSLKGIGEVRAHAIIRGRPYGRKDELVQKGIVPDSVYNEIKDQIIARQN